MFPFTLHQLRIFKTVAMEQSFTKASANIYISQPSLSRHILILEKNLGIQLLNRQTNKNFLTKKGKVLLKYSERILALCEESCRVITNRKNKNKKDINVGTNNNFGNYLLPKLLRFCNQSNPQFHLKIIVNSTDIIAKQILADKLDIILASEEIYYFLNKDARIRFKYYMTDTLHLILSNTHPFAKQRNISKIDLYNLNYITLVSNNYNNLGTNTINRLLLVNQIDIYQFKNVIKLDSLESLKVAVQLGLGGAFVPALAIEKDIELEIIKIIKIHKTIINQKLFIITTSKCLESPACKIFYNNLLQLKKS